MDRKRALAWAGATSATALSGVLAAGAVFGLLDSKPGDPVARAQPVVVETETRTIVPPQRPQAALPTPIVTGPPVGAAQPGVATRGAARTAGSALDPVTPTAGPVTFPSTARSSWTASTTTTQTSGGEVTEEPDPGPRENTERADKRDERGHKRERGNDKEHDDG